MNGPDRIKGEPLRSSSIEIKPEASLRWFGCLPEIDGGYIGQIVLKLELIEEEKTTSEYGLGSCNNRRGRGSGEMWIC